MSIWQRWIVRRQADILENEELKPEPIHPWQPSKALNMMSIGKVCVGTIYHVLLTSVIFPVYQLFY